MRSNRPSAALEALMYRSKSARKAAAIWARTAAPPRDWESERMVSAESLRASAVSTQSPKDCGGRVRVGQSLSPTDPRQGHNTADSERRARSGQRPGAVSIQIYDSVIDSGSVILSGTSR